MAIATILGFPRIGASRELKTSLEQFWKGSKTKEELFADAAHLRARHWKMQKDNGINFLPVNDFSFYDQMLDASALWGVVPKRYRWQGGEVDQATYFAMARGIQAGGMDVPAEEMTKWFDTNYHYIVPEFSSDQTFSLSSSKPVAEFLEARSLGYNARPVLIGPMTFLRLGKMEGGNSYSLLDKFLPVYIQELKKLEEAGVTWVQLDEPILVLDMDEEEKEKFSKVYATLRKATKLKIFVATYFGDMKDNIETALHLPIDALHIDLVRGPSQFGAALTRAPASLTLSLGVVDGRNIWRCNLDQALTTLEKAVTSIGSDRVWVSSSCSLLHVPYDLELETDLEPDVKMWMAFAKQKLREISLLTKGLNEGRRSIAESLMASDSATREHQRSSKIQNMAVQKQMQFKPLEGACRELPYAARRVLQQASLALPLYPTTTIGSFPQTNEVRQQRAAFKSNKISKEQYELFLKEQIKRAVIFQTEIGLDVLVHGEFERNDMVEYFGEQLSGFAFSKNGWVQSYGSRCVKPPIIYGDISRPFPMTVAWSGYAQSLTTKPMKGMLTGPVTILQWSFVRDDQPRSATAHQIALALQDEVLDLERAGIKVIQIDEPAFREGLPLRQSEWNEYLTWAGQAFRLSSMGVSNETQIHTHMCYAEFNDIISSVKDLDADVISIETSRSRMQLLDAFVTFKYPNEIGPGVYDIHSPRVPSKQEMVDLLIKAGQSINPSQLWVNPDCGLKTRDWPETKEALVNMIEAAKEMRSISSGAVV